MRNYAMQLKPTLFLFILLFFSKSYSQSSPPISINQQREFNQQKGFDLLSGDSECSKSRGILILAHGKSSHHLNAVNLKSLNKSFILNKPSSPSANFNQLFQVQEDEHQWENTILEMAGEASLQIPHTIEVAFGMWSKKNFQEAVNLLANQSVCELIIIPLFISDHSDVIRVQKYQFHLSEVNPLPFDPGRIDIPQSIKKIEYRTALNDSSHLSQIINIRAQDLSVNPEFEELILVAHGPNGEEDDLLWIKDLNTHASRISIPFNKIHVSTLRDDAPKTIRDRKTKELQETVKSAIHAKNNALIIPVLLAPGGIEEGLRERLINLDYKISSKMIAPNSHLVEWLVQESLR